MKQEAGPGDDRGHHRRREGGMSGWAGRLFPSRPKATAEQARQL
jgi:hypothetical protein